MFVDLYISAYGDKYFHGNNEIIGTWKIAIANMQRIVAVKILLFLSCWLWKYQTWSACLNTAWLSEVWGMDSVIQRKKVFKENK